MSENERLGIELYVIPPKGDTGTSFLKTLQESIDKISTALSAVDLSPLAKGVDKTTSSGKKGVDDFAKSISSLNNELSKTSRSSFKMDGLTEAAKAVASINTSTTSAIAAGLKLASTWEEFRKINAAVAKEMAGGVNSKASQILGAAWQNTKDPVTGVPDATKLEAVNKLLGKIGDSAGKSAIEVKTLLQDLKEMKLNDTVLIGIRKMEQPQDAHVVAKDKFSAGVASETDLASLSRQKELQAQILSESKKEAELRAAYRQAEKQGAADSVKNYQMELGFATQRKEKLIEEARVLAAKVKDEKQAWQDRLVGEKAVEQAISARTKAEIKANADVQASAEKANTARMQIYTDSRRNVQAESKASALMANPSTANSQLGVAINAVSLAKEAGDVDKLKTAYGLLRAEISNTNAIASANPWKNIFAGMEVGKTTLEQLTAKVREYKALYGSVDDKALSAMSTALGHHKAKWDAATQSVVSNKKAVSAWTKLFGESIGQMAARLTEFYSLRTVIFAVGSEFREAITASIKFSQNIHDIAAISGSTKKEMYELGGSILDIARHSRFTSDEVAKLVQILAQAGVAAADLPEVAASVGRFATATGSKPEQAADLVTTSLNVFDKKAEDTASITNVLTAALNESKLTTDGLATAFNYLAPQAEQLGMSLEQTAGIIATMAQSGIKPSTIGTGTSQLLKELSAPKGRLSDMLSYYSIKQEDVDPIKNSFAEIVATFQNATGKMGEQGVQAQHVMRALETRTARSLVTAMSLGSEAFERMTTSITGTNAAWVAYYKSMDGAEAKFNVIKQNFQAAVNGVIGNFSGIINGAATALTGLTNMMATTAGQIILIISSIAAMTVGVAALSAAVKEMTVVQTAWTAVNNTWLVSLLRAHPIIAAISLLMGAGVAFYYAYGEESKQMASKIDESNKSLFTSMEAIDKSSAGLRNAKQLMADGKEQYALNEYTKAVKKYGEASDEVNAIKKNGIKVTDNTVISLNKLKAEYPDYFADLKIEGEKVYGLVEAYEKLNKHRSLKDEETRTKYNTEIGPELKRRALAVKEAQMEVDEVGDYIGFARHKQKALEKRQAEFDEINKVAEPMRNMLSQKFATQVEPVSAGVSSVKVVTGFGEALKPVEKPEETVKPITPSGKKDKTHTASLSFDLAMEEETVKQSKLKLDEIMQMVKDKSLTSKEITQKELEVQAKLTKLYGADGQSGLLGKAIKAKVSKDLDSEGYTGTQREQLYAKRLSTELAQSKKDQAKYYTEFANYYKKQSDAFNAEVAKIKENAAKVQEVNDKRTLELTFKNMEGNAEDRIDAYYTYLFSVYDRNELEFQKSKKALDEKFAADDSWDEAAYNESLGKLKAIKKDANSKAQTETNSFVMSAMDSQIAKKEKEYDTELRHAQAALALKKQQVGSSDEVRQLDIQSAQAEEETLTKKQKVYATELKTIEGLRQQKALGDQLSPDQEALVAKAEDYKDKLQGINEQLAAQKVKVQEISDTSFSGNFLQGMKNSVKAMGDFASMTKDLGKSLTDSFTNGLSSTLSNTFTTMFNPDTAKINELSAKILELKTQKTTLESDISMIDKNTDKTPEEVKNLNDKRVALQNVNAELANQEAAVRKQKDAWQTFSDGLKGIMKGILEQIQKYIFELIALWMVQKLVGLVGGMFSGSSAAPVDGASSIGQGLAEQFPNATQVTNLDFTNFRNGGIVKGYAEGGLVNGISGGLIPESLGIPGKDSVPILAMPNEYVIPADIVNSWGAGHFEKYRNGTFKKMAEGGLVGAGSSSSSPNQGAINDKEIHCHIALTNIADPRGIPQMSPEEIVNIVSYSANSRSEIYKVIKNVVAS